MLRLIFTLCIVAVLISCQENEVTKSDFTGKEITYQLLPGSSYAISGTVNVKEKKDGSSLIRIELTGTEGELFHPVHLHLGDITTPDSDVAALLNPVKSSTGISETILTMLADESTISYAQILELNASIKVHLGASGPDKNIILAAGNIGEASARDVAGGRTGVAVCK